MDDTLSTETPPVPAPSLVTTPPPTPENKPPEPPPAPPASLTVEAIKLPEGTTVDKESLGSFVALMNDEKLTPVERGQKLIDLQSSVLKAAAEKSSQLWTQTQEDWQKQTQALPEFGGQALPQTLTAISKVIEEFGGEDAPKLREVFDFTGFGNHPLAVKFLGRVAKALSEGKPVIPPAPAPAQPRREDVLYPTMAKAS